MTSLSSTVITKDLVPGSSLPDVASPWKSRCQFQSTGGLFQIVAPEKRSYHAIVPTMVANTSDASMSTVHGVISGFVQPQGHVLVLLNMLRLEIDPQTALDALRIYISAFETAGVAMNLYDWSMVPMNVL